MNQVCIANVLSNVIVIVFKNFKNPVYSNYQLILLEFIVAVALCGNQELTIDHVHMQWSLQRMQSVSFRVI